jgi:uncharacterized protein (TIGR02284 family)
MDDNTLEQLKSLHTRAVDARKGYEAARDDAEGRGLTPLFQDMTALHETNARELSDCLVRAGAPANQDGSFMSVIHRTIMDVRSFFNGLDESVLPGLIDGEERNESAYDDALRTAAMPTDVRHLLVRQRDRIAAAIARMQTMRQTAAA